MHARAKSLFLLLFLAVSAAVVWRLSDLPGREGPRAHERSAVARPGQPGAREGGASQAADAAGGSAPEGERVSVEAPAAAPTAPAADFAEGFDAVALYGTIQDPEARPIEGARVLLFPDDVPLEECGAPLAACRSNAEGRFRFTDLGEFKPFRVYADAEGFVPLFMSRRTGVDEKLALARAAPFAGRVTDARTGAPLAGVEVAIAITFVGPSGAIAPRCASVTDAEGNYALPCGRLDRVQRVDVRRPGTLPSGRDFQVRADQPDGYDIELGAGTEVVLRIYDLDTSLPLAGREVKVGSDLALTTDARGRVRAEGPAFDSLRDGTLNLEVRLDGWCRTSRTLSVPPDGLREEVDMPMLRGAAVSGVVRARDGKPFEGATLVLLGRNRQLTGYNLPPQTSIRAEQRQAKTDAQGRFELAAVLPGDQQLTVHAWHDDYPAKRSEPFLLLSSAARKEVELELALGARISGTVTLNGEPVLAQVSWNNGDVSGGGSSNDSGAFRLRGVLAGQVHLSAALEQSFYGGSPHQEEVWVEDGAEKRHDIQMSQSRATITGLVKDAAGNPVPGIDVSCYSENTEGDDWSYAQAKCDAEGRFELKVDDKSGILFTVSATDRGRSVQRTQVAAGAEGIELVLPRMGKVRLEVVDASTHDRIESYTVYWRERDSGRGYQGLGRGSRTVSPGPDGVFEAELPVGAMDLRVSSRDKGYPPRDVPNVLVTEGDGGSVERVELERGVTLELHIVSADPAQKVPTLTVVTDEQRAELQPSGWNNFSGREILGAQRGQPGPDGKLVLKAMAPGRYTFHQAPKGSVFEPASFEVPPVDVHSVEIRWRTDPDDAQKAKALLGGLGYATDG